MITLPCILYLAHNNALKDFLFDYFTFNMNYSKSLSGDVLGNKVSAFFFYMNKTQTLIVFAIACWSILFEEKSKRKFNLLYLLYLAITVLIMCMAGRSFLHYGMTIIPALAYPYSILFQKCMSEKWRNEKVNIIISMILIVAIVGPIWMEGINNAISDIKNRNADRDEELEMVIEYISNNTETNEEISIWGNENYIYTLSERKSASKFSYQFPICYVEDFVLKGYFNDLRNNPPKVIVVTRDINDDMTTFLNEEKYELILELQKYTVYAKR